MMNALLRSAHCGAGEVLLKPHIRHSSIRVRIRFLTRQHRDPKCQCHKVLMADSQALYDRFKDPTSPFHLPPGTQGPDSPDPPPEDLSPAEEGRSKFIELGFDPESFWEQPIVWGDHDAFQHVNNVRYLRFLESGRIHWMRSLGAELGGPAKAEAMIKGKGVSLILKSISLDYKRPVVYPDTLLIAHKPHHGPLHSSSQVDSPEVNTRRQARTHFHVKAAVWSYAQRRIVTESDSVLVWYDYDKLTKCDPGEEARAVIQRRMDLGKVAGSS